MLVILVVIVVVVLVGVVVVDVGGDVTIVGVTAVVAAVVIVIVAAAADVVAGIAEVPVAVVEFAASVVGKGKPDDDVVVVLERLAEAFLAAGTNIKPTYSMGMVSSTVMLKSCLDKPKIRTISLTM